MLAPTFAVARDASMRGKRVGGQFAGGADFRGSNHRQRESQDAEQLHRHRDQGDESPGHNKPRGLLVNALHGDTPPGTC
jgi:hypothetical protein